jgi:dTDP-glucose 4,6-dehydratase
VTGGAGFIGSHFVRFVLSARPDAEITNLDALTYAGNLDNLRDVEGNPRYRFVKGDICDADLVEEIVPGHDAILNFAAESHVDRSIVAADDFVRTNVLGAGRLLDAARRNSVGRFLQVSTDETYGSIDAGSFREDDRLDPSSPYSAAKAGGDLLARAYHKTYGLPVVVVRASNTFGPNQFPEKLIPLFVTNLLRGIKVPLYGDGRNVRDWTHVEDVCSGIDVCLDRGVPGEIYNVAANNERMNRQVADEILRLLRQPDSMIEFVPDRLGHDRRYSVESSKIRALGWAPRRTFEEALASTVEWYRANAWWWEPLLERVGVPGGPGSGAARDQV